MEIRETIFEITIAALAVIGFYGVLHGLLAVFLTPRELSVAVVVTRPLPPEELDILLCEARRTPCGRGKRVVLVLSRRLWEEVMKETEGYAEVMERYGATLCFMEDTP